MFRKGRELGVWIMGPLRDVGGGRNVWGRMLTPHNLGRLRELPSQAWLRGHGASSAPLAGLGQPS